MVSVCAPSGPRSKFAMENAPAATTACSPLTVTDVALPALPEILTIRVLINEPGRGELNVRVGGRTVITVTFAVAVFPAASVASAVIVAGRGHVGCRRIIQEQSAGSGARWRFGVTRCA